MLVEAYFVLGDSMHLLGRSESAAGHGCVAIIALSVEAAGIEPIFGHIVYF